MKVIAINGSPRKGGNTEYLLNQVLEPIKSSGIETELIQVGGQMIRGCMGCGMCAKNQNRKCVIENDIVNEVIEKLLECDAMILGSPTYFADITPELKAVIDRAGYVAFTNGRLFKRKIGAAVVVNRRAGAVHVQDSINHMFMISQMIVPGSTYFNMGVARAKGEVASDQEAIANMLDLGETIAWLLKSLPR